MTKDYCRAAMGRPEKAGIIRDRKMHTAKLNTPTDHVTQRLIRVLPILTLDPKVCVQGKPFQGSHEAISTRWWNIHRELMLRKPRGVLPSSFPRVQSQPILSPRKQSVSIYDNVGFMYPCTCSIGDPISFLCPGFFFCLSPLSVSFWLFLEIQGPPVEDFSTAFAAVDAFALHVQRIQWV